MVLAAAGLKEPMAELAESYRKSHPKVNLKVVYAGSGDLLAQLRTKKGDLYIPASQFYMEKAINRHLIDPKTVKVLAYHVPVLVVRKNKAKEINALRDLEKADIRLGIGDPKAAAIGRISVEILKRAGLYDALKGKIAVETPTVNQLLVYLKTGQIDAAIIWKELALRLKGFKVIEIPPSLGGVEKVEVGVSAFAKDRAHTLEFENYLLEHREIFKKYGFSP